MQPQAGRAARGPGTLVIDARALGVVGVGEGDEGAERGRDEVAVTVQAAGGAAVLAVGEGLGHALPAQAVLAQRGGERAGAAQPVRVDVAVALPGGRADLGVEGAEQQAGGERDDTAAPAPGPQ